MPEATPAKSKRQLSTELTQQKIKNTVINLMCDKDFDQITIREICRVAEVSVGTFYLYFESKEAALLYSHRYIDDIFERMEFNDITDPVAQVYAITDKYLEIIAEENFFYIQQIYIAHIKCYTNYLFAPHKMLGKLLTEKITAGQEQGEISTRLPARDLTRKLMIAARGQVYDYCINPANSNRALWLASAQQEVRDYAAFCFHA